MCVVEGGRVSVQRSFLLETENENQTKPKTKQRARSIVLLTCLSSASEYVHACVTDTAPFPHESHSIGAAPSLKGD